MVSRNRSKDCQSRRVIDFRLAQGVAKLGTLIHQCDAQDKANAIMAKLHQDAQEPDDNSLGDQLRAAIEASGMTMMDLSRASGLDYASVHRFIHGERDLGLAAASKLTKALGIRFTLPRRRR